MTSQSRFFNVDGTACSLSTVLIERLSPTQRQLAFQVSQLTWRGSLLVMSFVVHVDATHQGGSATPAWIRRGGATTTAIWLQFDITPVEEIIVASQ